MPESKQVEYKDTINLPSTTLEMRANAAQKELVTQKFWEDINVYEKNIGQRNKNNKFVLHDGPPYLSSDKIHIGTALNKVLKDILVKYKAQAGFYAPYVPGYDAHGLPIENAVVKNIKGGREAITPAELRAKCREFALKNLKGQENEFKRLGVWGNWEQPYLTIAPDFEAEQIRVFGEMYKKGYVEKGLKPVYWCASCETALAEAEVEYADHTSTSIYVRFKFTDEDAQKAYSKAGISNQNSLYAVIWTTTPWTIPSNMAVCLNPRLDYTIFEYKNENYIVATELLKPFIDSVQWEEEYIKALGENIKGRELELLTTKHPLYERKSPIVLGDHVTLDAGTGCVHTAPGHGLEDWEVSARYGIDTLSPLNSKGVWTLSKDFEDHDLVGVPHHVGNKIVIEKLEANGSLITKGDIQHSYPHCWRCKKPVMYRATAQWFVKVDRFKEQTLEAIKNVQWIPQAGETRITNMVEGRSDWCISRQRAWGVPIPVFYCDDCGEVIVTDETIANVADKFDKESSDAWVKYSAKELLPEGFKCTKCSSSNIRKETDIMDVWFDSGCTHRAVVAKRKDELGELPVEMYLEGSDQHRGWFQSSLLTSVATTGKAPYKSVLTHGFVMDGEGRKMSKSLGNVVRPDEITKVYGADVLRLWAASVDYRNDIKIGDTIIKQLVEIFKKIRNTARFLLGNLYDFDPANDYVKYEELKEIDKYALDKLQTLIKNVTEAFDAYEFYKYYQYLQNFAATDLSSCYLDIVKDRLYTAGKKSISRRACQTVLYETLQTLVRILVPVMPHQAEDIWQNTPESQKDGLESILLSDWPKVNEEFINQAISEKWEEIIKLREIVTKAIEPIRAQKIIGSSLETAVYIKIDCADLTKAFKTVENELNDVFITSQARIIENDITENILNTYEEGPFKVFVTKAEGEKCERCWKFRELGIIQGHETICKDCYEAIKN